MAFATLAELEARYEPLTDPLDIAKAEALLDDASVMLASLVKVDSDDEQQAAALKVVTCAMVKRAMAASSSGFLGMTQGSITADIYTQSATLSNPSGDLYITKPEKRMLGMIQPFIGSIPAKVGWCG